jgi:hypothetical protein
MEKYLVRAMRVIYWRCSSFNINIFSNAGEQDARVLTLAEQIIAAMPDRIKVLNVTADLNL